MINQLATPASGRIILPQPLLDESIHYTCL
jgi:hypothetical protein